MIGRAIPFAAADDRVPHLDPLLRHLGERRGGAIQAKLDLA